MHQLEIEFAYEDHVRLVHYLALRHQRAHGGQLEDLLSEAHEHFVAACHTYQHNLGAMSTWLTWRIRGGLLSTARKLASEARRLPRITLPPTEADAEDGLECVTATGGAVNGWRLIDLLDSLSDDARYVVRVVLQQSSGFRLLLRIEGSRQVRNVLRDYLKDHGWTRERIDTAFQSLEEAL